MHEPRPLGTKFWTPGVIVMAVFMVIGFIAMIGRFTGGIGYVTNLSNEHPWGIWVAIDVASGVALAAGGFTTSAIAHIFGKHKYEDVVRPALLTAALGYTFVVLGLIVDIGRSWAIWKPVFNHNYDSVLFEVAMCVAIYLHVLYIELIPIAAERYGEKIPILGWLNRMVSPIMSVFIIAGVVLSCMHQSSLGSLMLVAPTKMHPLWYTPILPLLFLTSAFAVGYPMVVFETGLATRSMKLQGEMEVLSPLSRYTIALIGIYGALKIGDVFYRGAQAYLFDGTAQSNAFLVEVIVGVILPFLMLITPKARNSRGGLFFAMTLIVAGVLLNRINVFLVAFTNPFETSGYLPAIPELAVTVGLVATLMFVYRLAVTYLPIISAPNKEVSS